MHDILPPNRARRTHGQPVSPPSRPTVGPTPSPVDRLVDQPETPTAPVELPEMTPVSQNDSPTPRPRRRRGYVVIIALILLIFTLIGAAIAIVWYQNQLSPLNPDSTKQQRIEILNGATPEQIADELQEKEVIRSARAFSIYVNLHSLKDKLQAGTFLLSPADSVPEIADHLTSGKTEEFKVTFFPGGMLRDPSDTATAKKTDAKTQLTKMGFSDQEIEAAFTQEYQSDGLFAGRPAGAGLEGYIYGDTYNFPISATPHDVIQRSLNQLASVVKEHNLEAAYKKQGLSLFEGITLASIIQREVYGEKDEKIVAQIFLDRLKKDMPLGADATFEYAAKQTGRVASPDLDSPYNTRINKGLPPGPISSPGLSALLAVAQPADTDYLYFVSGDDEVNYFAKTLKEHEANTAQHCRVKCGLD